MSTDKKPTKKKTLGILEFPGNPWPDGHRIENFVWTGRLDPERGLWFDLHLESADYEEGDAGGEVHDGDPESEWESRATWGNYHACSLSSTKWADQMSTPQGMLVATEKEPLDFDALTERTFRVDCELENRDLDVASFGLYLLGHDTAADHTIRFSKRHGPLEFAIDWSGRIALTYAGDDEFKYAFTAAVPRAEFGGVRVPPTMSTADAKRHLAKLVVGKTVLPLVAKKR